MQKKLKIAIVIGGGWSLGAFAGGAAWELVRQVHSNRDRDRFDRCEIDVLCGAGAGALTAAVLLRTLANPDGFRPTDAVARLGEAQRAAWIEGFDFTRLMGDVAMRKPALLDRDRIDELVLELLAWPTGERAQPVLLGRRVLLGMALLNFNGVPIRASNTSALPDTVSTTRFRDFRTFCFDLDRPEALPHESWRRFDGDRIAETDTWREVAATAVASGAFPIAFEPVVLQRFRHEYGPLWPDELEGRTEFPFTYGDSGAFNHQPLREAMDLVSAQDAEEKPGTFTRVLIFIDPNLSGSKHAFGLKFHLPFLVEVANRPFNRRDAVPADPVAHLVAITNRFGVLVRHQGMYEDVIAAERVNARHAWRSESRALIAELVGRLEGDATIELLSGVESRLTQVLDRSRAESMSDESDADREIERVAFEQTGVRKPSAELPSGDRLAFALMALLDQVAGLSGKQQVHVVLVGPTTYQPPDGSAPIDVKLAGDFFANFGGYFDPRFRVHDFDAGRALASSALAAAMPPLLAEPSDRPAYRPWSDPPPSLDTAPAARDRFVRRIAELTRQLLAYKIGYMGVTQAISIVAQYVAPRLVRDSGPARRPAIIRVEVASGPEDAAFYLAGTARSERGGNARQLAADLVVLHTVLHYSDAQIVGPHVIESPAGPMLRLIARRSGEHDVLLDLPLPPPIVFQRNANSGLPIHSIRVDWPNRCVSAWMEEDALRQWPGVAP